MYLFVKILSSRKIDLHQKHVERNQIVYKVKGYGTEKKKKMPWQLLQDDTPASDSRLGFTITEVCSPGHATYLFQALVVSSGQCESWVR